MIALTRGIGESLLSLTSKGSAEPPAPTYEPETLAFESRVLSDGGKILDIEKLDNFYKVNKAIGKYNSLQFAVSKQFGYKVSDGNIVKIYDASKNGNDLDISRGTVAEDIEHDMFFLNNTFFKDETVTMDVIGDEFTLSTKINHPNPEGNAGNYIMAFGGISFLAGGTSRSARLLRMVYFYESGFVDFVGNEESFNNQKDGGTDRLLYYRHSKSDKQNIFKDKQSIGIASSSSIDASFNEEITKIILGGRLDEHTSYDADCYLNNTFFYNKYLTDQELEDINDTL